MYWYGLNSLVFWALAVVAVVAVIALVYSIVSGPSGGHGPVTPEQILAERFARGEIDEDEFWQRMTTLRAGRVGRPSSATASCSPLTGSSRE
jgi:putative membrane protein